MPARQAAHIRTGSVERFTRVAIPKDLGDDSLFFNTLLHNMLSLVRVNSTKGGGGLLAGRGVMAITS